MHVCIFEPTEVLLYVLLQFFYIVPQASRRLIEGTSVHTGVHSYIYTVCLHILEMPFKLVWHLFRVLGRQLYFGLR